METTDNKNRKHAVLSASSASRWLHCTPSARAEENVEDTGSDFAREGTLAHAMAALELKKRISRLENRRLDYTDELEEIGELSRNYFSPEMEDYVEGYVNYCLECRAKIESETPDSLKLQTFVEAKLDYSESVPEGFGTGDCVICSDGILHIIDLKYGKGVKVSAVDNPQLKLYAIGALDRYGLIYDIDKVRLSIYQPRVGNLSEWEISVDDLEEWKYMVVQPLAQVAWLGLGARQSGAWCRFCKVKGECPRLAADSLSVTMLQPDADTLNAEDYSKLLPQLEGITDWVAAVKEASLKMALNGSKIPGYKVVEGRSVRTIINPEAVAKALAGRIESVWKPRELQTLTFLEKAVGKKEFGALCGDYVMKPKGKPTLVEESDKRKPMTCSEFADVLKESGIK